MEFAKKNGRMPKGISKKIKTEKEEEESRLNDKWRNR